MATLIQQFQLQLISAAFTLLAALIKYLLRPKSRLIYSRPHGFTFFLKNENGTSFNVSTSSIWVTNAGREPANEVEVTFNYPPQIYSVWPARNHEEIKAPDDRYTLKFANIAPKEFFQIELLVTAAALPEVINFRSKEGVASNIMMIPMRVYPKAMNMLLGFLVLVGATTLVYLVLSFLTPYLSLIVK